MSGYGAPKKTKTERLAEQLSRKRRQRALTDEEIRKGWEAAAGAGTFGLLARFCLLAGTQPTHLDWNRHVLVDRIVIGAASTKQPPAGDSPNVAARQLAGRGEAISGGTSD